MSGPTDDHDRHAARLFYSTGLFSLDEVAFYLHRGTRFVRLACAGMTPVDRSARKRLAPPRIPRAAAPDPVAPDPAAGNRPGGGTQRGDAPDPTDPDASPS